nr:uncharacterized protein LOC113397400 isoform X2 [Vanessa tameamea]
MIFKTQSKELLELIIMSTKIIVFFAFCSLVMLAQAAPYEEAEYHQASVLYVVNLDMPTMLTESINPMTNFDRSSTVCTADLCQRVCQALNYKFGRCNANNVCVCSNF